MADKTSIANDSHLLKEISQNLINSLKDQGVAEDVIFDVHVGFEEALRNAMIHGNRNDPDKKVTIETEISDNTVIICIEDEGDGFDPGELPDPTVGENLLREGGRGVYLINHLMDEVIYENGGRRLIMKKFLDAKHV